MTWQLFCNILRLTIPGEKESWQGIWGNLLNVKIPALIIHPLVENAIQHGLFNKQGKGMVSVSVTEGDYFIKVEFWLMVSV
jgi:hypothetical protein